MVRASTACEACKGSYTGTAGVGAIYRNKLGSRLLFGTLLGSAILHQPQYPCTVDITVRPVSVVCDGSVHLFASQLQPKRELEKMCGCGCRNKAQGNLQGQQHPLAQCDLDAADVAGCQGNKQSSQILPRDKRSHDTLVQQYHHRKR
jgi:hypothetical protein